MILKRSDIVKFNLDTFFKKINSNVAKVTCAGEDRWRENNQQSFDFLCQLVTDSTYYDYKRFMDGFDPTEGGYKVYDLYSMTVDPNTHKLLMRDREENDVFFIKFNVTSPLILAKNKNNSMWDIKDWKCNCDVWYGFRFEGDVIPEKVIISLCGFTLEFNNHSTLFWFPKFWIPGRIHSFMTSFKMKDGDEDRQLTVYPLVGSFAFGNVVKFNLGLLCDHILSVPLGSKMLKFNGTQIDVQPRERNESKFYFE